MSAVGSGSVPSENTVVYRGFSLPPRSTHDHEVDLRTLRTECFNAIGHRLAGFFWQEEGFNLALSKTQGRPCLEGSTCFGDNIDDEWFIVDLIFNLSEVFPHLAFQIEDSDGDFLLIEAAEDLPNWLSPLVATNRVFVHDGALHVIPLAQTPAELTNVPGASPPSLDAALVALRDFSGVTRCPEAIQLRLNRRRREARSQRLHYAHCLLPARVATILRADPCLISPASLAFYHRDQLDNRALRVMKTFQPNDDVVLCRVAFTRCQFAQLTSQNFVADRKSPWKMPPPNADPKKVKTWNLGAKIVCGFEILANQSKGRRSRCRPEKVASVSSSPEEGPRWKSFLDSLLRNGFFKGELEGSQGWRKAMKDAEAFFRDVVAKETEADEDFSVSGDVMRKVEAILGRGVDLDSLREEENRLEPEDDESWLNIDPDELDQTMKSYWPKERRNKAGNGEDFNLDSVTQSFKAFVNHVSDLDGVEFPDTNLFNDDELDSDDEIPDVESKTTITPNPFYVKDGSGPSFDPKKLAEAFEALASISKPKADKYSDYDQSESEEESDSSLDDLDSRPSGMRLKDYMAQMDQELSTTTLDSSFAKANEKVGDGEEVLGEISPADLDFTLVQNILKSYAAQPGVAGPATNILSSMGVQLPDPET